MKTPKELLEQIIRAKTALHLRLVAERNAGKQDIGGKAIDEMIGEVDLGLLTAERMLVFVKNEAAAAIMLASESTDQVAGELRGVYAAEIDRDGGVVAGH